MNKPMKNTSHALTLEEFKIILQLMSSNDIECKVLGQTFAKHYGFLHPTFCNYVVLDRTYIVTERHLYPTALEINERINYEEGYQRYLSSNESRGIL